MSRTCLAIALLTSACGQVTHSSADAASDTPPAEPPVTYKGTLTQTQAMPFGGSPYCDYTITLKQLEIELVILPLANQVVSGSVDDLNVEAAVPPCPNGSIPVGIARYTFAPAAPAASNAALTFTGDSANAPNASLSVQLMSAGNVYQANLGFHRTDSVGTLNWSVLATVPLAAQ
jgi:hypothetical protein